MSTVRANPAPVDGRRARPGRSASVAAAQVAPPAPGLHARLVATHRRWAVLFTVAVSAVALVAPAPGLGLQLALLTPAVLLLGLPHGAFDLLVLGAGPRALRPALGYAAAAGSVVALWWLAPVASLVGFLVLSALHFGRGELAADGRAPLRAPLELAVRGALPIALPLWLHADEVAPIFAWLASATEEGTRALLRGLAPWLGASWLAGALALLARVGAGRRVALGTELGALLLAHVALPPLLAFTVYFCLWHSVRHGLALDALLRGERGLGWGRVVRGVLPVVALTWLAAGAGYLALSSGALDPRALVRTLFVALAALTVPHLAVTLRLERAMVRPARARR